MEVRLPFEGFCGTLSERAVRPMGRTEIDFWKTAERFAEVYVAEIAKVIGCPSLRFLRFGSSSRYNPREQKPFAEIAEKESDALYKRHFNTVEYQAMILSAINKASGDLPYHHEAEFTPPSKRRPILWEPLFRTAYWIERPRENLLSFAWVDSNLWPEAISIKETPC